MYLENSIVFIVSRHNLYIESKVHQQYNCMLITIYIFIIIYISVLVCNYTQSER